MGAAPQASFLFTSPVGGGVTITCNDIEANPVQTLALAAAPNGLVYGLLNWAASWWASR